MRILLLFCFSILSISLAIPAIAKTKFKSSDEGKPILVKANKPEVTISLPANRTTGYAWFLSSYNKNLVQPLHYKYSAPKGNKPGAPGVSIWTFRVLNTAFVVPQILKIKFVYCRPWIAKKANKKTVTLITQ